MSRVNPEEKIKDLVATSSSTTLLLSDSGAMYASVSGGDDPVTFTLPSAPSVGATFHFEHRDGAEACKVDGGGGNIKTPNGFTVTTQIHSVVVGSTLSVIWDGSNWAVYSYSGMWENSFDSTQRLPSYCASNYATGSVAGSGGTWTQQVSTGLNFISCLFRNVYVAMPVGTSTDTDVEIYDADPSGAGVLIYRATGLDLVALEHKDPNVWWGALQVAGEYWIKVTNNGAGASEYDVRTRVKGDD